MRHRPPVGIGICDFSGFKFPLDQLVRNWDGAMVHRRFVDKRNPQDFVRGVRDNQALPFARPEGGYDPYAVDLASPLRIATPYNGTADFTIRIRGEAPAVRSYEPYEQVPQTDTFLFPNQVQPEDL